jgi:hypothetical protein
MSALDPARVLREVFDRAWHDWRDIELSDPRADYSIPWNGDALLELLVADFERTIAATQAMQSREAY